MQVETGQSEQTSRRPCWGCQEVLRCVAPFCHACGLIQPPTRLNHFEQLNLPVAFEQDESDRDRQYFGLQRAFHPDRFAAKSAREHTLSLEHASNINESYATLKSPVARALHMLEIVGHRVPGADGATVDDPELLMEAMEMREALADAETAEQAGQVLDKARSEVEACEASLAVAFDREDYDSAVSLTLRLRYLTKLATEARDRRHRLQSA